MGKLCGRGRGTGHRGNAVPKKANRVGFFFPGKLIDCREFSRNWRDLDDESNVELTLQRFCSQNSRAIVDFQWRGQYHLRFPILGRFCRLSVAGLSDRRFR